MKLKKAAKFLLAALTGAMLMTASATVMASNSGYESETVDASVPKVANLKVMYQEGRPFATFDNALVDDDDKYQRVVVEWSETNTFPDDKTTDYAYVYRGEDNRAYMYNLEPGRTYYVRAYMKQSWYDADDNYQTKCGPISGTITYTATVPDVSIAECDVATTSVSFTFGSGYGGDYDKFRDYSYQVQYNYDYNGDDKVDTNDGYSGGYEYNSSYENSSYENVTGFEIYRATGSGSYKLIATVADTVYKDTGLKSNTSYRYKIRAYALNAAGKKVYGDYAYQRVTTWGRSLEVKATAKSSTSVKLKWNKVTGADGYRIYRYVGGSNNRTLKNGTTTAYSAYELIKTIKKAGTVTYTDKKLTKGENYSYRVEAYKNVNGTKKTLNIQGYASITLGFDDSFYLTSTIEDASGNVSVTWNAVTGAEGYKVEKKDASTSEWKAVKTLSASTTSYKFTVTQSEGTAYYRIYAYAGNNVSYYNYVDAEYVPTYRTSGITATAKADLTGVEVSWTPVSGAAYYKVYRSRQMGRYNADKGYYNIPSGQIVQIVSKAGTMDETKSYYVSVPEYTSKITKTSVTDTYQGYQYKATEWNAAAQKYEEELKTQEIQEAPAMGVRYYYYVQAFKQDGTPIIENVTDEEWDETIESWKEVVRGTRTETYYRGGLSGKPASVVLNNVSLSTPKISSVTSAKKKQATVSWKKVKGATKYYVYYSTKKNSGYTFAGITTKAKLTVTGLTSGKKYYFKVKACTANAAGADVYSSLSAAKNKKVK